MQSKVESSRTSISWPTFQNGSVISQSPELYLPDWQTWWLDVIAFSVQNARMFQDPELQAAMLSELRMVPEARVWKRFTNTVAVIWISTAPPTGTLSNDQ